MTLLPTTLLLLLLASPRSTSFQPQLQHSRHRRCNALTPRRAGDSSAEDVRNGTAAVPSSSSSSSWLDRYLGKASFGYQKQTVKLESGQVSVRRSHRHYGRMPPAAEEEEGGGRQQHDFILPAEYYANVDFVKMSCEKGPS